MLEDELCFGAKGGYESSVVVRGRGGDGGDGVRRESQLAELDWRRHVEDAVVEENAASGGGGDWRR